MRNRIVRSLAPLASSRFQQRFIVEASAAEYVLPDELIEDALSIVDTISQLPASVRGLSAREFRALEAFGARLRSLCDGLPLQNGDVALHGLTDKDGIWDEIRVEASACVDALGVSLSDWEETTMGGENTDF